jgi:tetratricopeptide (TPR) repeat protein
VSLNKLGDFYLARGQAGDAELALTQFEESLKIRKQIFEANPNSAQAARDLSVSYERLGDFYLARGQAGDAELALTQFEESLKIDQRLFEANPNSAQAARDLSVSLSKVGRVYLLSGDSDRALRSYQQALQIGQALHQGNPDSSHLARDLSVLQSQLAEISESRGEVEQALKYYDESLYLLRHIAEGSPDSMQAARDVVIASARLGECHLALGSLDRAYVCFEESLQIALRIASANPMMLSAERDVIIALFRLGKLAAQLKIEEESLLRLTECRNRLQTLKATGNLLDTGLEVLLKQLVDHDSGAAIDIAVDQTLSSEKRTQSASD